MNKETSGRYEWKDDTRLDQLCFEKSEGWKDSMLSVFVVVVSTTEIENNHSDILLVTLSAKDALERANKALGELRDCEYWSKCKFEDRILTFGYVPEYPNVEYLEGDLFIGTDYKVVWQLGLSREWDSTFVSIVRLSLTSPSDNSKE